MLFAALLIFIAVLMARSSDGASAVILGVLAFVVWIGVGRFARLVAGIAMMLRAFGA